MLKPVEKQRVAEEIVEQLRSLILTGQYTPGSKLPPERELSKKLGVNRASLREALKKLEHLGLVRIRQGDGTRVQDFTKTGGIELVSHLLPLIGSGRPEILRDVLEFRRMVGREIARLAAERATGDDIAKLRALGERAAEAEDLALFEIDFDFYLALTEATGNMVMGLLANTVRNSLRSYTPLLAHLVVSAEAVRAQHTAILAAREARDPAAAAAAADEYLRRGAEHAASLLAAGQMKPVSGDGDDGDDDAA